tara:strand:- start:2274 stop:2492 length:219 start_codon:yes stop_codon:yes gene_type:complete
MQSRKERRLSQPGDGRAVPSDWREGCGEEEEEGGKRSGAGGGRVRGVGGKGVYEGAGVILVKAPRQAACLSR